MQDAISQILELIQQGKKMEAIKVARDTFGLGLKESKEMIEALEQGKDYEVTVTQTSTTEISDGDAISDAEVIQLIEAGAKLQAIKLVKESHNIGLKEAKEYVDSLENSISAQTENTTPDSPPRPDKVRYPYQEQEDNSTNSILLWVALAAIAALVVWYFA